MTNGTRSEEDERIRSYLVSQAERADVLALWPRVVADRTSFLLALDRVTDDQERWRPPSDNGDSWSILEVAQHMLLWEKSVTDIVEALAAGGSAEVPMPGAADATSGTSLAEIRAELTREAVRFASFPERLPFGADLTAVAEHPQFGPLNHRAWFLFARLHDGDHLRQIEAIKGASGYPS